MLTKRTWHDNEEVLVHAQFPLLGDYEWLYIFDGVCIGESGLIIYLLDDNDMLTKTNSAEKARNGMCYTV